MTGLVKALLGRISADNNPTVNDKTLTAVQFNPTSLRVQISNKTSGGQQAGSQARQRPGTGEMVVSFDLVFDTADEGAPGKGVSVLTRTRLVEQFVRPQGSQPGKEAPPRVVFKWGSFMVQGIMDSANIDLDLFDESGVPLRAKVGVSIKGQDPNWTYTPSPTTTPNTSGSPGTSSKTATTLPAGSPGTVGNSQPTDQVVQAMPGESLAQVAARSGFDPAAWRALASGVDDPMQLPLGQEVALPAGTSAGGASGQAALGADPAQTSASLPLVAGAQAGRAGAGSSDRSVNARDPSTDPVVRGLAVAGIGGLAQAIAQTRDGAHQEAATSSLGAFGVAAASTADATDRPWGVGVPLRPRFGSVGTDVKRDPSRGGWVVVPVTPPAASVAVTRTAAPSTPARTSAGCGCRGRRSRRARAAQRQGERHARDDQ